jgi:hypothetical protein
VKGIFIMNEKQLTKILKAVGGGIFAICAIFFLVISIQVMSQNWDFLSGRLVAASIFELIFDLATAAGLGFFAVFCILSLIRDVKFEKAPLYIAGILFASYFLVDFFLIVVGGLVNNAWLWVYLIFALLGAGVVALTLFTEVLKGYGPLASFGILLLLYILLLVNGNGVGLANNIFGLLGTLVFLVMVALPFVSKLSAAPKEEKKEEVIEGKVEEKPEEKKEEAVEEKAEEPKVEE